MSIHTCPCIYNVTLALSFVLLMGCEGGRSAPELYEINFPENRFHSVSDLVNARRLMNGQYVVVSGVIMNDFESVGIGDGHYIDYASWIPINLQATARYLSRDYSEAEELYLASEIQFSFRHSSRIPDTNEIDRQNGTVGGIFFELSPNEFNGSRGKIMPLWLVIHRESASNKAIQSDASGAADL